MLDAFVNAIPRPVSVNRFDCFEQAPLPCNDCRFCYAADGCAKPDLKDFYAELEASDLLVFATPVYNLSFPAPLKALIDRLQRYWAARFIRGIRPPIEKEKCAVLLTSSGTDSCEGGAMLEKQLNPVLTVIHARLVLSLHHSGSDSGGALEPVLAAVRSSASKIFE